MDVQFPFNIVSDTLVFDRPDIFKLYVRGISWSRGYITIHKEKGQPKTLPQLAYYYAVILPTAYKQMVDDGNDTLIIEIAGQKKEIPLTEDIVDKMFKHTWAKHVGEDKVFKSKMTKEQCSQFMDYIIRWCALHLGCVIPEADENWRANQ